MNRRLKPTLFFSCLLLFAYFLSPAQLYPIHKYSAENGLAHSNVFRIMQDKRGFLWFSTNYGISCFNGVAFKNYTTENGLSGNVIMSITELEDESKLICTMNGLDMMRNDSISHMQAGKGEIPVHVIYAKKYENKIWLVALLKGYDLFCIENNEVRKVQVNSPEGEPARVTKLEYADEDGLVLVSDKGLYHYKSGQGIRPFLRDIVKERITSFKKDRTGNFWIGLDDRLLCVTPQKVIYTFRMQFNSGVSDLLVDSKNNIWAYVPQLGIILIQGGKAMNITDRLGIKKILINNLYEDNEKNIWMATHGDGVYKISSLNIIHYLPESDKLNVYAKALYLAADSAVLTGSYGTVSRIKDNRLTAVPVKTLKSTDYIYFLRIKDHTLYMGLPNGLLSKDLLTNEEKMIYTLGSISILDLGKDSTWIGGFQNIGYIKNGKYTLMNIPMLKDKRVNVMVAGSDDTKWLGTDSGLYKCRGDQFSKVDLGPGSRLKNINGILEDAHGVLWVATDQGLLKSRPGGWQVFTETDGLSNNKCNVITEDRYHNIWVGTQKGLNRIDAQTLRITEHPTGLYPNEILSLVFDNNYSLVVGTVNGIAIVKELDDEITTRPPPAYITGISTADRKWTYPAKVVLNASDRNIIIDFIALSYSYPDNVEYRYRLGNAYKEWNITKHTSVELSSLNPGIYDFIIQARVNGGEWGKEIRLSITLPLVFWKTPWFITAGVLLAVIGFFFLVRWWLLRKSKKEKEKLELQGKMIHLRQLALNALINPHFIFNCLNSIQHYLNRNDKDLANSYLARFGKLIRLTLEYAQEMYIPLAAEMERLNLYLELEKLRCGELLKYTLAADKSLLENNIIIPNMVLQPYVENAIWHGIMPRETPGQLNVNIRKDEAGEICITIEDDGTGIEKQRLVSRKRSPGHISVAMNLIKERLELFGKESKRHYEVSVIDRSALDPRESGTIIKLNFPVING